MVYHDAALGAGLRGGLAGGESIAGMSGSGESLTILDEATSLGGGEQNSGPLEA